MANQEHVIVCGACFHEGNQNCQGCRLSHIFPPHRAHDYAVVHRIFTKILINRWLRTTTDAQLPALFENRVLEARLYEADPIGGCAWRLHLRNQIIQEREEEIIELQQENHQLQQEIQQL